MKHDKVAVGQGHANFTFPGVANLARNMRPIVEHIHSREDANRCPPRITKRKNAANKARNRAANLAARCAANQSGVWHGAVNGTPLAMSTTATLRRA